LRLFKALSSLALDFFLNSLFAFAFAFLAASSKAISFLALSFASAACFFQLSSRS
jgi:hypothetical protein